MHSQNTAKCQINIHLKTWLKTLKKELGSQQHQEVTKVRQAREPGLHPAAEEAEAKHEALQDYRMSSGQPGQFTKTNRKVK